MAERRPAVLKLSQKAGESLTYQSGKTKDKETYTLKVPNRPEYFRLASYKAALRAHSIINELFLSIVFNGLFSCESEIP